MKTMIKTAIISLCVMAVAACGPSPQPYPQTYQQPPVVQTQPIYQPAPFPQGVPAQQAPVQDQGHSTAALVTTGIVAAGAGALLANQYNKNQQAKQTQTAVVPSYTPKPVTTYTAPVVAPKPVVAPTPTYTPKPSYSNNVTSYKYSAPTVTRSTSSFSSSPSRSSSRR